MLKLQINADSMYFQFFDGCLGKKIRFNEVYFACIILYAYTKIMIFCPNGFGLFVRFNQTDLTLLSMEFFLGNKKKRPNSECPNNAGSGLTRVDCIDQI